MNRNEQEVSLGVPACNGGAELVLIMRQCHHYLQGKW